MAKTFYIHGMVSDGDDSVDKIAEAVNQPERHIPLSYGWISRRDAYAGLRYNTHSHTPSELAMRIGKYVFDNTTDGSNIVAHSLGAIATWCAMWLGRQFNNVILFAAAIDEDRLWPAVGMKQMYNIHCMDDRILRLADGLVLSDFGALGKYGYSGGYDPRIENIKTWPMTPLVDEHIHSFYFQHPDLGTWTDFVIDKTEQPF